jgi:hypothetical protein
LRGRERDVGDVVRAVAAREREKRLHNVGEEDKPDCPEEVVGVRYNVLEADHVL